MESKRSNRLAIWPALTIASLWFALPAHAELGGAPAPLTDAASVRVMQRSVTHAANLAAAASTTGSTTTAASAATATTAAYTVRETTLGSGTVVREYLSAGGTVFGAAWNGPVAPSFAELFGTTRFSQFASGVAAAHAASSGPRGPDSIDGKTLVVHMGGHMGSVSGQAWLPQALPAGVTGHDIQ